MHGGAKGSGGPWGGRNGNFKHGVWTRESVDLRRVMRAKVHQRLIVLREGRPGSLAIWFNVAPAAMRSHTRFPTAGLKMWRESGAGVSAKTSIQWGLVPSRSPNRQGTR
jgi:hypothetical protein